MAFKDKDADNGLSLGGALSGLGDKIGLGGLNRTSNAAPVDPNNFQLQGQDERRRSLLQQADYAGGRGAPGIAGSGFRGDQSSLISMLQNQAAGRGPSAAQGMLKDALGRNVSSQQALLATGGPGGARQASMQAGALGGSLANQGAHARVQEQLGAQGLLSQTLQGARGQDQQLQGMRSDAELRSRGLNDAQIARLRQMELDNARLGLQGSMGLEDINTRRRGQDLSTPTGLETLIGGVTAVGSLMGGGGLTGGGVANQPRRSFSDDFVSAGTAGGLDQFGPVGTPSADSPYSDDNLAETLGL